MDTQIKVTGFHIISNGDPSVGIFEARWELSGPFFFEDPGELEAFRVKLKEAWEWVADDAYVESFEEREAWIKKEEEGFKHQEQEG